MSDLRFDDSPVRQMTKSGGFRLDKARGKVMGVCAGIANYFNVDVILGFGTAIIVYLLIGLIAD